jgi:hypothetical protein
MASSCTRLAPSFFKQAHSAFMSGTRMSMRMRFLLTARLGHTLQKLGTGPALGRADHSVLVDRTDELAQRLHPE